jgi:glycosyltransferase involved in cell wall biosynthesis
MNTGKRLLFLTPRFPYPPFGGDKLFVSHVARALRGHALTLLSLCSTREEMDCEPEPGIFTEVHKVYLPKRRSYWNVLSALPGRDPLQLAYYSSLEFRRTVGELVPRHDAVLAHLIRTAPYAASSSRAVPRVLLMADAISLSYQRMLSQRGASRLWNFLYRAESSRLARYERAVPSAFDQTWLHSEVDREFLHLDRELVRIVPVGVDLREFPFDPNRSGNVVAFIGNMSSSFNLDACRHFIGEILPRLRREIDLRFRIVGACPDRVRSALGKLPNVEVTGAVGRVSDAMDGVFCGVCPLRAGAGIQNKILNYLALGIPCVTSQIGLEGLRARDGRDLLVYRSIDEAARMILALHRDAQFRFDLATNGRRFVESEHDWSIIYRRIQEEVSNLWTQSENEHRGQVPSGSCTR